MKDACPSAVAEVLPVVVDQESSDTMKALLSDSRIGIGHGSTDKAERYAQCIMAFRIYSVFNNAISLSFLRVASSKSKIAAALWIISSVRRNFKLHFGWFILLFLQFAVNFTNGNVNNITLVLALLDIHKVITQEVNHYTV